MSLPVATILGLRPSGHNTAKIAAAVIRANTIHRIMALILSARPSQNQATTAGGFLGRRHPPRVKFTSRLEYGCNAYVVARQMGTGAGYPQRHRCRRTMESPSDSCDFTI